jgi:hypothetical protein
MLGTRIGAKLIEKVASRISPTAGSGSFGGSGGVSSTSPDCLSPTVGKEDIPTGSIRE